MDTAEIEFEGRTESRLLINNLRAPFSSFKAFSFPEVIVLAKIKRFHSAKRKTIMRRDSR